MENNRLNFLLNGLAREKREQQRAEAEAAKRFEEGTSYQDMIDLANRESAAREFLRDFCGETAQQEYLRELFTFN